MLRPTLSRVLHLLRDRRGVTAAEYAILAVALVAAVGTAMAAFGPALAAKFTAVLT